MIIHIENLTEPVSSQEFSVFWNPSQVFQKENDQQNLILIGQVNEYKQWMFDLALCTWLVSWIRLIYVEWYEERQVHIVSFFNSPKCCVKEKSIVKAGRGNMSFEELSNVGNNPGNGTEQLAK